MMNPIDRYRANLEALFRKSEDLPVDPEIRSSWAQYMCVLVNGFLEVSLEYLLNEYARVRSAPTIRNFVASHLEEFQNPKIHKMVELIDRFDGQLATQFKESIDEETRDAVGSIVGNRHLIVHGKDSSVTIGRVRNWYSKCDGLVQLLARLTG